MTMTLILAGLWMAATAVAGALPAPLPRLVTWALIALGVPLLGLVTLTMGPVWGMVGLIAGAVALRRPILRAGLWHGPTPRPPEAGQNSGE